ncbi:hypothetical protein BaRGS_00013865 [Batillaria attramentaria]|uniref:Neurotransmitter-gated ion-channel ligand-binding domain-containing protein n=1 Tax=Batillaria attramentaria TaxID=370345 RepID=A0ABD0L6S2_9CAEN
MELETGTCKVEGLENPLLMSSVLAVSVSVKGQLSQLRAAVTLVETDENEYRLIRDLLTGYDKRVRPSHNYSESLNVTFGLALAQIIDVGRPAQRKHVLKKRSGNMKMVSTVVSAESRSFRFKRYAVERTRRW